MWRRRRRSWSTKYNLVTGFPCLLNIVVHFNCPVSSSSSVSHPLTVMLDVPGVHQT